MIGLDTSVVVRLIIGQPADQCAAARRRLELALTAAEPVIVSDLVIGESYYALQHHYGVPRDEARALLRRFLESGAVTPEPSGIAAVLQWVERGAGLLDRLIHLRYHECGAATVTFDVQQSRLRDAVRLRP
mgnify:CR=1 FL=1